MSLVEYWKVFVEKANSIGVPLPMVRDPKIGKGSITATLVVISSCLCIISIVMMMAVFISKITTFFTLNDTTVNTMKEAFSSSIQLFIVSLGGYLGRKMQKSSDNITMDRSEKDGKE